jgi:hypothetical protein
MFLILLLVVVGTAQGNQLDKLISFVRGGANPNVGASSRVAPTLTRLAPGSRPSLQAPIPFAEVADPSRGVVDLDVPQPRRQGSVPQPNPHLQHHRPRIFGLPAGATQVGGNPVRIQERKPAPLSEVQAPIFLSTTFPNILNDVDPESVARFEPQEALRHNLHRGQVPRPVQVPGASLPVLMVLGHRTTQDLENRNQLNYDRFGNQIFPDTDRPVSSQQRAGEHIPSGPRHDSFIQADTTHTLALEKHKQGIQRVRDEELRVLMQNQLNPDQESGRADENQRAVQAGRHQHQSSKEHQHHQSRGLFKIPGADQHRQYTLELKLAQDALKALG